MSGVFVFRQPPQGFHTEYFGGGGGKGGTTVQSTQIPPEVLARYNAVNARAEAVANKPFQRYGGEFVAPINDQQRTGIAGINAAANMAQPYYADAMKGLTSAQALSDKYLKNATSETYAAKNVGQGYADTAGEYYTGAEGAASPYYNYAASGTENAVSGAEPYLDAATIGTERAVSSAQPYMDAATLAAMYGAAGVNPQELQTERYMNPYVQNVVNTTQAALNQKFGQQNAQQQSEAIKAGAFGGDRSGIARGVLRGQQGLTMARAISPLYADAYNNALKTAGEQQGVYLSAGQKNREAIQKASDQISALGKQGYDMRSAAAKTMADLGKQGYDMRSGAALQMQGIGKDIYGQKTTTGEKVAALGAQQFGQGNKTAEQIAAQGKQGYDTGASTAKTTADVGTAAQKAGLEGAQAQIAAGTLEQQTKQAEDTARYQQHLQEQGYDFQVAQFLANIAEGTGALSGNTTSSEKSGGFFSNRGGFKVNERPARAYGGGLDVNSMGGAVYDPGEYSRGGYSEGGSSFSDILAAQQAMYMGQGSPYGQGQKPGLSLGIPSQSAKITPLQVKPIAQEQRGQDPLTQAANFGKGLVETKKAGQEIKSWFDKKPEGGKGETAPADGKTADPTKGGVLADSKGNVTVSGQAVQTGTNNGMTPSGPVYSGPKVQGVKTSEMGGNLNFGPEIKDPGKGLAFNTSNSTPNLEGSTAGFGSAPDMGGDQVASLGEDLGGADFGDLGSWFGNRGGAVPDYACGGVAGGHRDGYAGKGFVTPGYDPEVPGTDIMDTTVDEGEQSVNQLKGEQDAMNPKISGGGGGGSGIGQALGTAISIGKFFLKDGGAVPRYGYADGGGSGPVSGGLDIDRLNALLSAGSKSANTAPISYKTDDGTEIRGQTVRSGPFAEYGVGLGTNLGGGRLDVDAARGSAPNSPAQYRGGLKWSKNFADGGLAYREHHANPDETNDFSNVVGEKFNPEDVAAAAEENAPTGVDPRLVALTPDRPVRETTMDSSLMANESGGDFRAKNDAVGHGGMKGHFGRGQFGQARLQDAMNAGVLPKGTTPEQFMDSEELQKATEKWHFGDISQHIANKGLDKAIGTTINGIPVTEQGMLNVAHLGGKGGLEKFIASGGKYNPADENGTSLSDYLAMGSGVKPAARTAPTQYAGNAPKSASIGDVVREYAPSGTPTSENFWVPALGFLGGMLTSPNRSLAGAIGSGLVSGTSGYMELRKGQQEDIKNAFNTFKDQFEDALDPVTGAPAKRDKYTGNFYAPNEAQNVLAKKLRAIGADPANYGVMESKASTPAKTGTGTATSELLPPPTAGGKPAEKATDPEAVAQYAAKLGIDIPQKPPADMPKTDMSPPQLEANAFWNWKQEGLSQDPIGFLKRIDEYRKKSENWAAVGGERAQTEAKRYNDMAESQSKALKDMLANATKQDVASNLKIKEALVERSNKHADTISPRIAKYRQAMNDVDTLAFLQSEGLASGISSESVNKLKSIYQYWTGKELPMAGKDPAGEYELAVKLAAARVADSIKEIGGQRAPGVTSALEGKIAPDPSRMTPAGLHLLLGKIKGDATYNLESDTDYLNNHMYRTDPAKHPLVFDNMTDDKGAKGQEKYNRYVAKAYSSLPVPTQDPTMPEVSSHLRKKYGEDYAPLTKGAGKPDGTPEGRSVVRSGTVNSGPNAGKRIIEYSDGTREYQ